MIGPKAIIHLERLRDNYRLIKNQVGDRKIMAVVKANAYGNGVVPGARTLQEAGVDFFAVFTFEEAVELRVAGIAGEILIFSRLCKDNLDEAVERNITVNLAWPEDFDIIRDYHRENGRSPVFHLKVDTGMTRLGVPYEDVFELLELIKQSPELHCAGIYSHYATADEGDLSYANFQLSHFNRVVEAANKIGIRFKYIHFSNSGSIINLPQSYFNLIRVGMLLYGAFPSDEVAMDLPIKPVMEFVGPIVMVRRVKAGTNISYGGVFQTSKESNIGVIQTGFADGFPRSWYEGGSVCYKGQRYKIAGRICMDQFMVDFEDTKPVVGENVLLFGENSTDSIRIEEIAQSIGSTTYTLMTAIHGRTERIFTGA